MRKRFVAILASIIAVVLAGIILTVCLIANRDARDSAELKMELKRGDSYDNYSIEDLKNRKSLIVNGNGTSWNNLYIETNAKAVTLKNFDVTNSNGGIGINVTASNVTVRLQNISVKMVSKSGVALKLPIGAALYITDRVELAGGDGAVSKNGGNAVVGVGSLTIGGDGTLNLFGGTAGAGLDGIYGQKGISYSTSIKQAGNFKTGSDGRNGGNGVQGGDGQMAGKGGDALSCTALIVQNSVTVNCYGGNSNKSGNGAQGGDGGNVEGATSAKPWQIHAYAGGKGGNSGNGGNGGDESRPGYGIICEKASIGSSATVTAKVGQRGESGKGGKPGNPGKGGESMDGAFTDWNGQPNGSAGLSGQPGSAGKVLSDEEIVALKIGELSGEIIVA